MPFCPQAARHGAADETRPRSLDCSATLCVLLYCSLHRRSSIGQLVAILWRRPASPFQEHIYPEAIVSLGFGVFASRAQPIFPSFSSLRQPILFAHSPGNRYVVY